MLGDLARPGYDAATQYISELGELGAPNGQLVSLGGFLPIGVLALAFVALAAPELAPGRLGRAGAIGIACVGAAYAVAAFARCDPGCPAVGPTRQVVHNLAGVLQYFGGSVGLLLLGASFRARPGWRSFALPTLAAGLAVLAIVLLGTSAGLGRGAVQRVADGVLFLWIAAAGRRLRPAKALAPA